MGFGWCASERDRKGDGIRDRKSLESPCVKELISQIVDRCRNGPLRLYVPLHK
jgi:hypothetical protein